MENPIDWCKSHFDGIKTGIDLLAKIATILTIVAIFFAYNEYKILDTDRQANISLLPSWKFKNDGGKDNITFAYENNGSRVAKDVRIEIAIDEKIQDLSSDDYMIDLNPSEKNYWTLYYDNFQPTQEDPYLYFIKITWKDRSAEKKAYICKKIGVPGDTIETINEQNILNEAHTKESDGKKVIIKHVNQQACTKAEILKMNDFFDNLQK